MLDVDLVDMLSVEDEEIAVGQTYVPHMNDPLEAPLFSIIAVATITFSPPLSPLTRHGQPHNPVDSTKPRRTVSGRLFPATFMPVTYKFARKSDIPQNHDRTKTHNAIAPINESVDYKTPWANLVMTVNMPRSIGSR